MHLNTSLQRRFGITIEAEEGRAILRTYFDRGCAETYIGGQLTDITALMNQASKDHQADIERFTRSVIDDNQLGRSRAILAGGGMVDMGGRLINLFGGPSKAEILPEPLLSPARGLAKLAQRKGYLEG
jgi:hypothetical protein